MEEAQVREQAADPVAPVDAGPKTGAEALGAGRDHAVDEARALVRETAQRQKERAAEGLGGVADALHEASRKLLGGNQAATARYTDMAADQIERMSQMLRDRSLEDLVGDAEAFARRQPALFLGGALAAGFVLARVLRNAPAVAPRRAWRAQAARNAAGGAA